MYSTNRFLETRPESADRFAMQLALSRVHPRLVPMRRVAGDYEIHPGALAWFELPAGRGLAGYGLGRALRMLLDILRGLTALHDTFTADGAPFAHGEVALTQLRVDPEGVCRLVPLTTRHCAEAEADPAPAAAVLGHLAPERLLGEVLDARADVFSAGVLLWEALAGRRLFEEVTSEAIIDRLMSERLHMPQLPPELAWAIPLKSVAARALAVDPHQRFSDCGELATAIAIVARERVATHAEIASFFGAVPQSVERRVRASVAPRADEPSSVTPAVLVPSSGPRSQRGDSASPPVEPHERPVPSQSQTFSAVTVPSSARGAKRSTLAPLGPASSRPAALPTTEAARAAGANVASTEAASDPSFTPVPRAFRSSSMPTASARSAHKSPFSALLMPPLAALPAFPPATKAAPRAAAETEDEARFAPTELVAPAGLTERQSALQRPLSVSEPPAPAYAEPPRSSQAPRSARLPPSLPQLAPVPSVLAVAKDPVPSTKSTFALVAAPLPVISDEDVIDAATMFRRAPGRKLWTVLAISSVSAALAVAALTHESTPSSAAAVAAAKASALNAASAHAPTTLPAGPASSVQVGASSGPAKSGEVHEHSATHARAAAKATSAAGKLQPGEKDYGI
jgi:serine/threonine-protein kinase